MTVRSVFSSVLVTPANATVPHGSKLQFAAVALDQFHNPMTGATIAWSVSGLGSINGNGLYTAPTSTTGTATVRAKITANGIVLTGVTTVVVQ